MLFSDPISAPPWTIALSPEGWFSEQDEQPPPPGFGQHFLWPNWKWQPQFHHGVPQGKLCSCSLLGSCGDQWCKWKDKAQPQASHFSQVHLFAGTISNWKKYTQCPAAQGLNTVFIAVSHSQLSWNKCALVHMCLYCMHLVQVKTCVEYHGKQQEQQ